MDLMQMYNSMGIVAKCVAVVLIIMSMWSLGVGIERFFTYQQARNQSKLYAPQVAKHLKEGRLKDAVALSSSKNYRYSHLAKVVLAGLQEYQFQQESNQGMSREDIMDTVRRAIQRASALTASDLKKGVPALATIGSTAPFVGLFGTVWGILNALVGIGIAGQASIDKVAGPVGEALIMTAIGLFVAVPAVMGYNWLLGRNKLIQDALRNFASDLHAYLVSGARVGASGPGGAGPAAAPAAAIRR